MSCCRAAAERQPGGRGERQPGSYQCWCRHDRRQEITLAFDQATVDLDALQRSAYAMAAEMTVDIRICGADYVCTLFPRQRGITDDEVQHQFRAEVNDQILRVRIAKETEPLRNLVFALAFSQTGLVDPEGAA